MGGLASSTPDSPPNRKVTMNPIANSIGVSKANWPCHMVPIQLKNLTPVVTAIRYVVNAKNGSRTFPVPDLLGVGGPQQPGDRRAARRLVHRHRPCHDR